MAYEIDFIGVKKDKCESDADAICLRWKAAKDDYGRPIYKIGVVDGGFSAHGEAMRDHMNQYYFDDKDNQKSREEKVVDFVVVTHPDQDHTVGLKTILQEFNVQKLYMNRPWLYAEELFDQVNDGRKTVNSLANELRDTYKNIADLEDIAEEYDIPICEAFQGTEVSDGILICSPSKEFYLDLLVESTKNTFLQQDERKGGIFNSFAKSVKNYLLTVFENWDIETLRDYVQTSAENETSVVLRGIISGAGFLLTGDAGIRALTEAMDYLENEKNEDIKNSVGFYQIPHHGGRHNVGPKVLNRMIGPKVGEGESRGKAAIASVAEGSDHPLRMVTNAYIRRGVRVVKTDGYTVCHHNGDMPDRGWTATTPVDFSDHVEKWDD